MGVGVGCGVWGGGASSGGGGVEDGGGRGEGGGGALTRRAVTKSIPSNQTVDSEPNRRVQSASVGVSACVAGLDAHAEWLSPSCLFSVFFGGTTRPSCLREPF